MEEFDVKKFNRQKKISDAKRKVRETANGVAQWVGENKELVGVVITGLTGTVVPIAKGVLRRSNLGKEKDLKEKYCYDRSLGHYWEFKRKLSNREWTEVENRRKRGEKLGDIFKSMNVLR